MSFFTRIISGVDKNVDVASLLQFQSSSHEYNKIACNYTTVHPDPTIIIPKLMMLEDPPQLLFLPRICSGTLQRDARWAADPES